MSKVILKGYIEIPEEDLEAVLKALPLHKELTLSEAGCLIFKVEQNREYKHRFDVYEEFTDKAAFELHQKRARDSDWGEVTVNGVRHYEININAGPH